MVEQDCQGSEPDCRQVLRQLRTYLDGETPGDFEAFVARHLTGCSPCLQRAEFEREVRHIVAAKCREGAPPGLLDRVRSVVLGGEG
jgi:anti-sigma factor (TIGR02949 family)